MGSLAQAFPTDKWLSKKCKASSICEVVDREKYIEPVRQKFHIFKLEWDWVAKLGQSCHNAPEAIPIL